MRNLNHGNLRDDGKGIPIGVKSDRRIRMINALLFKREVVGAGLPNPYEYSQNAVRLSWVPYRQGLNVVRGLFRSVFVSIDLDAPEFSRYVVTRQG
jgi:hypothetical protein